MKLKQFEYDPNRLTVKEAWFDSPSRRVKVSISYNLDDVSWEDWLHLQDLRGFRAVSFFEKKYVYRKWARKLSVRKAKGKNEWSPNSKKLIEETIKYFNEIYTREYAERLVKEGIEEINKELYDRYVRDQVCWLGNISSYHDPKTEEFKAVKKEIADLEKLLKEKSKLQFKLKQEYAIEQLEKAKELDPVIKEQSLAKLKSPVSL